MEINVNDIVWREDLYPRFEPVPEVPESGYLKQGNRLHLNLGPATNGNCPEPLKGLYAGYIERGIIYIIGSVAKHFYFAYRDTVKDDRGEEKRIQAELVASLKSCGWIVERESYTSQGRIDVLATRENDKRIIEVKIKIDSNSMAHALGQLLFYSKFHPGATLWIYTPQKPDLTVMSILNSFGVQYLEVE